VTRGIRVGKEKEEETQRGAPAANPPTTPPTAV
jgi:hypothetical protein